MPSYIGERFLNDSEYLNRFFRFYIRLFSHAMPSALESGLSFEMLKIPFQGGKETQIFEQSRMQIAAKLTDSFDNSVYSPHELPAFRFQLPVFGICPHNLGNSHREY